MIGYKATCKYYGIKPLTQDEENQLSDNEKIIRQCKIDVINLCTEMLKNIDIIEQKSRIAKELDDNARAEILVGFRSAVRKAESAVREAAEYGRSN